MLSDLDERKQDYTGDRQVLLKRGEIIEFRFFSPCNFRTIDNKWFRVSEEVWNESCVKIGDIFDSVNSDNVANLEEIWRLKLFDFTGTGKDVYQEINKIEENEE